MRQIFGRVKGSQKKKGGGSNLPLTFLVQQWLIKSQKQARQECQLPSTPRTDPYVKNYLIRLLPLVDDAEPLIGICFYPFLLLHVSCQVLSVLTPASACRSQSVFSEFPLSHRPFLQNLRC